MKFDFCLFTMISLLFAADAWSTNCNSVELPFTDFGGEKLVIGSLDNNFCVSINHPGVNSFIPLVSTNESPYAQYLVGRQPITSSLQIFYLNKKSVYQPIELTYAERSKLHFEHLFVLYKRTFFLAYNVELSIPSGRRFREFSEGLQLYEIIRSDDDIPQIKLHSQVEFSAGIETPIHSASLGHSTIVCANTQCKILSGSSLQGTELTQASQNFDKFTNSDTQLIELATNHSTGFVLLGRTFDDRFKQWHNESESMYMICAVHEDHCFDVAEGITPFHLSVKGGAPDYRRAKTDRDFADLLQFDLTRLRQSGVATFAENNLEGRVAWSAVYYINGLITLASNLPGLGPEFDAIRRSAKNRVQLELEQLTTLYATAYPSIRVKRYSLDREPIFFLLHQSRIARVFLRAERHLNIDITSNFKRTLIADIEPSNKTIEKLVVESKVKPSQLRLKKRYPFWSDGANVPWNYQSGWINALSAADLKRLNRKFSSNAQSMLTNLVEIESLGTNPRAWRYSAGDFFDGWTREDDISTNTPNWPGDKFSTTTAHISYRTMDAMALLAGDRVGYKRLRTSLKKHLLSLADSGDLWPLVMDEYHLHGQTYKLPNRKAQYYLRSTEPYQVQNQVWAIAAMTKRFKD